MAKRFSRLRDQGRKPFLAAAFLCLGVLNFSAVAVRAASFTASLDSDTITLGEQATLSLRFEGGSPQNSPSLPEISGLNIGYVGRQSLGLNINGIPSSIVTFTYALRPQKAGEFVIPAMTADANGQRLASQPLKLTVLKANAPSAAAVNSGNEVAFMKLVLPQQKVYVGQVLTAELQIYLRDDVENFGNLQFASTPADGFVLGKNAWGRRYSAQIGNRAYTVVPVVITLTASKTGNLSLGPFTANLVVLLPSSNQRQDLFSRFGFHSPFSDSGEQKQVSLTTDQINVQSLPLPEEGRPANFNGAVGNYTMTTTAGPTNVAVGDPITVRVQISGHGALDAIKLPAQSNWNDFKLFPPTSKVETSGQLSLEGTKTFEVIVAPQNTVVHELPPLSFSFFNSDDASYHTLTQPAMQLAVHSAGTTPLPILAAKSPAAESQTPQDILPIKEQFGALAPAVPPLVTRPAFIALQSLPVLAWLAAFVWRRRADSLANNPRLRRQRQVAQLVRDGLDDLRRLAAENNSDEFFATLFRLLQEQLGERLDCPAASITESVVDERVASLGVSETTLHGLRELFQLCNQARYAPMRGSTELNYVVEQFGKIIGELQSLKT